MDEGNKSKLNALHMLLDKELLILQSKDTSDTFGHNSSILKTKRQRNDSSEVQQLNASNQNSFDHSNKSQNIFYSQNSHYSNRLQIEESIFNQGQQQQSQPQQISLSNSNIQNNYTRTKQIINESNVVQQSSSSTTTQGGEGNENVNIFSNQNLQKEISGLQSKIQYLENQIKSHQIHSIHPIQNKSFNKALDTFSVFPSGSKRETDREDHGKDTTLYPEDLVSRQNSQDNTSKKINEQEFKRQLSFGETKKKITTNQIVLDKQKGDHINNRPTERIHVPQSNTSCNNSYIELEKDIKNAEKHLHSSKRSIKSSHKLNSQRNVNSTQIITPNLQQIDSYLNQILRAETPNIRQRSSPQNNTGKKRTSSNRPSKSPSQNNISAPRPFFPVDCFANDYLGSVEMRQKIQAFKKQYEAESLLLQYEKEKSKEINSEIERISIKVKKIQMIVNKGTQDEDDYQRLVETFQKSEDIRQQQKELIDQLREEIDNLKGGNGRKNIYSSVQQGGKIQKLNRNNKQQKPS